MKHRILAIAGIFSLCCVLIVGTMKTSWAVQRMADFAANPSQLLLAQSQWYRPPGVPAVGCQTKPKWNPPQVNIETTFTPGQLTLERFRRASPEPTLTSFDERLGSGASPEAKAEADERPNQRPTGGRRYTPRRYPLRSNSFQNRSLRSNPLRSSVPRGYTPREEVALANPSNFGERYLQDVNGQPVNNAPMIVVHETVIPAWQTVKIFQTYHARDADQASYHALIKKDGTIFYTVPPDKRAFGAGDSVFNGETVKTNRLYSPSVNNFAYHISFESPPDGRGNGNSHSGYTDLQYESLAWLVSRTGVPDNRVSYHKAVDRSGSRKDPRSFDTQKFQRILSRYPKTQEIAISCPKQSTESPIY
jgi:N-acetylmuramoyl-L-alanine amidase